MLKILLVVPTLDSYQLLGRLVRSLEEQSFSHWRVLFIDGESNEQHKEWLRYQCNKDNRFRWEDERYNHKGIFAAMNQGFRHATEDEWILFWGSDDIAAEKNIFEKIEKRLMDMVDMPDLYICRARYYSMDRFMEDDCTISRRRFSTFIPRGTLRDSLFWGSTPPHQATLFGPGARKILDSYDEEFRLAGDLDYFLRLSEHTHVQVFVDRLVLVLMGDSGVSANENKRRFKEVLRSYKKSFGYLWYFPFLMRYLQRIRSLLVQA
jgi:glycosyltransferase involved in cell wall biosynthesis